MGQSVWRPLIIMLMFVVFFNLMYGLLLREGDKGAVISYSRFRAELTADNLKKVTFKGGTVSGEFRNKTKVGEFVQGKEVFREVSNFTTTLPAPADATLLSDLTAHKVEVVAVPPRCHLS